MTVFQNLRLTMTRLYYGTNPGRWKSRFSLNRLLLIFDSDEESSFGCREFRVQAKPGMWFYLPPFVEIEHEHTEKMLHLSIHFKLEITPGIELPGQCTTFFHGTDSSLLERASACRKCGELLAVAAQLQNICWQVIAPLFADPRNGIQLSAASGLKRYSRLLEYLQNHLSEPPAVAKMAELAGMGRELFVKNFRADTGCSPKRFFHRLQIRQAEQLLLASNTTIKEVAAELGFCNEFYFSRFFKQHTGVSPLQFRRQYQQGASGSDRENGARSHRFGPFPPAASRSR